MKQTYSTKNISQVLLNEIKDALKNVTEYGRVGVLPKLLPEKLRRPMATA